MNRRYNQVEIQLCDKIRIVTNRIVHCTHTEEESNLYQELEQLCEQYYLFRNK